ncbi:hypothetical protein HaLaN_13312, partial [Haematococcus lacustris]
MVGVGARCLAPGPPSASWRAARCHCC